MTRGIGEAIFANEIRMRLIEPSFIVNEADIPGARCAIGDIYLNLNAVIKQGIEARPEWTVSIVNVDLVWPKLELFEVLWDYVFLHPIFGT